MSKTVRLNGKLFEEYLSSEELQEGIVQLAARIDKDYEGKNPHLIVVLKGSFIFASDLIRYTNIPCRISFVQLSALPGKNKSRIKVELDLTESLEDQHVIIVEDIVSTGNSIDYLVNKINFHKPASITIASLLFKRESYIKNFPIDYCAFEIPNKFMVGYGLDFDDLGRNLNSLYALDE